MKSKEISSSENVFLQNVIRKKFRNWIFIIATATLYLLLFTPYLSFRMIFGAVSYLNAQPLLRGISYELIKATPSKLLSIFESGKVDAALLSLYDILQRPQLKTVDNIAIGCRGPVYSVILAYEGPLEKIKKIRLDPASHTSNHLIKIILKKFHQLDPEFVEETNENISSLEPVQNSLMGVQEKEQRAQPTILYGHTQRDDCHSDAVLRSTSRIFNRFLPRLLIGDPAIAFRQHATCSVLDLGKEWYRFTGLPFVFARWCLRTDHPYEQEIIHVLQQAKEKGIQELTEIAAASTDPAFALRYFTEYIHYECGVEEERGIKLFQDFLQS